MLVPLVDDEAELDTVCRRYVFRLPRALAFRSEREAELVRSHFDVAEKVSEIVGRALDDTDALARLIRRTPSASRRVVAIYRRGRRWERGRPLGEQESLGEHMQYLARLAAEGRVESAGPFHELAAPIGDAPVGLVVFRSDDLEALERDVEADPAVRAGVMECDVLPWYR